MAALKPLCVIPARAGSKRLPAKNVAMLCDQPLLAYTVKAALGSGIFSEVFVSTESAEIADVARSFGAAVPFLRPPELSADDVTNVAVSLHWHEAMSKTGHLYNAIVCLQPSSPLRSAEDIRGAWDSFVGQRRDFLVSVTSIDPHYFHWAMEEKDGFWKMFFGDKFMTIRQNLPEVYRPNGAIKIARPESLKETGNFFGNNLGTFNMVERNSVHVATKWDLLLCEAILSIGHNENV